MGDNILEGGIRLANITQHEAAELWEIARDHHLAGAKLLWMAQGVQDPHLRSMMQQHAQRFQQVAQQLDSFLHDGVAQAQAMGSSQPWQASGQGWQGSFMGTAGQGGQTGMTSQSQHPIDVLAAGECLKECKSMAVKCMWSATEASQPARGFLQQLAGEHLHMAEQHYRWLEQRGLYASPKADQQAIQMYNQKLHQIAQSGQQAVQMAQMQVGGQQGQYQQNQYGQPYQHGQSQYGQSQFGQHPQYAPYGQSQYGQPYGQTFHYSQQQGQSLGQQYGQQYGQHYTQPQVRQ